MFATTSAASVSRGDSGDVSLPAACPFEGFRTLPAVGSSSEPDVSEAAGGGTATVAVVLSDALFSDPEFFRILSS
jgi:hypothetical protein